MTLPAGKDFDGPTLSAGMDRLLPPNGDLPGAGGMRLASEVEGKARQDARFGASVSAVLDGIESHTASGATGGFAALVSEQLDDLLRSVESTVPDHFGVFLDLAYTVYYSDPRVHQQIGWHGRTPQPDGNEMSPFDESVLNRMRDREPFWRRV